MSASPRRLRANQANAQRSTGPRTAAGKAVASANARQHGILSRHLLLPGEDPAEFNALLQELMQDQQPVGTLEMALVERMAVALWRQRRLVAAEAAQVQSQQVKAETGDLRRIQLELGNVPEGEIASLMRESTDDLQALAASLSAAQQQARACLARHADGTQALPRNLAQAYPALWARLRADWGAETAIGWREALAEKNSAWHAAVQQWLRSAGTRQRVAQAILRGRQAALLPRQAEVLSRYQSTLDNDLYKSMRALRDAQRHRLEQAVLNARPIEPEEGA